MQAAPAKDDTAGRFASFAAFYPFYLSEHRNATCRALHFAGSTLVLVLIALALVTRNAWWLVAVPTVRKLTDLVW